MSVTSVSENESNVRIFVTSALIHSPKCKNRFSYTFQKPIEGNNDLEVNEEIRKVTKKKSKCVQKRTKNTLVKEYSNSSFSSLEVRKVTKKKSKYVQKRKKKKPVQITLENSSSVSTLPELYIEKEKKTLRKSSFSDIFSSISAKSNYEFNNKSNEPQKYVSHYEKQRLEESDMNDCILKNQENDMNDCILRNQESDSENESGAVYHNVQNVIKNTVDTPKQKRKPRICISPIQENEARSIMNDNYNKIQNVDNISEKTVTVSDKDQLKIPDTRDTISNSMISRKETTSMFVFSKKQLNHDTDTSETFIIKSWAETGSVNLDRHRQRMKEITQHGILMLSKMMEEFEDAPL